MPRPAPPLPLPDARARPGAAYGDGLGRCFELGHSPALSVELAGRSTFAVTHLRCDGARAGLMPEIPVQNAYLAVLHLGAVRHHETWLAGRPVLARGYGPGALQILDLRDAVATYLAGPWDALGFHVPRALLRAVAAGAGTPRVERLASEPGVIDPVLAHLGAAALALLPPRQPPSGALLRRFALATCAHLVQAYGVAPGAASRRGARRLH